MSALRPPGLGPIVGHTTPTSCRLWIRAGDPEDEGARLAQERRTVGVIGRIGHDAAGNVSIAEAYYFRLQREFDRTGTFVLGQDVSLGHYTRDYPEANPPPGAVHVAEPLSPDTVYTVRMATLSIDDPLPNAESISDRVLIERLPPVDNMAKLLLGLPAESCEVSFRTFPAADQRLASMAFLVGSCRYPGFLWKIKEADHIFAYMQQHLVDQPERPAARFSLMVGDQIYADMLNKAVPIMRADTYQEFQDRYKEAFGAPNLRKMLRTAPIYMILDDHEIEDNWSQDRIRDPGKNHLFNVAIGAYMSYQWSHGPRTNGRMLFYDFACGGYPFFVFDTRTQRFKEDLKGLEDNHMLGRPSIDPQHKGQLRLFLDWLVAQQKQCGDAPKFVVSSSVFVPNDMGERIDNAAAIPEDQLFSVNHERREDSDSWPAYPKTRRAVLDTIVSNKVQNVVFLTGDIHCSNIARMRIDIGGKDSGLFAYDITSSAFYWPFPFADGNPNHYVHDSTAEDQIDPFPVAGGVMNYRAWAFTQEDNFCRVTVDRNTPALQVEYFNRNGEAVKVTDEACVEGRLVTRNTLPLAAW